jgi:limonene 1,2-monooxygenase
VDPYCHGAPLGPVLLDHLTRGRAMLGVGPGSLPTDSAMIGLTPTDTRELMDTNFDVVMRFLRGDEPVSVEKPTHELVDARLHLRPYSEPHMDVAVAAVASPTGRGSRAATGSACSRSARR